MNSILNEKVQQILKDDYEYLKTLFPQDRILGLFTYGKVNYGFAEDISDICVKMYYLPDLEELCTSTIFINKIIKYNNHSIKITDIRLILDNILNQEGTTMECFFAENYIITPKFKTVFIDIIINRREEIFRYNPADRINQSVNKAYEALEQYNITKNLDYLFEVCRIRLGTSLYLRGEPVENCIKLKKDYHINYLWSIKRGLSLPNIQEVKDDLKEMHEQAKKLEKHPELENLVKSSLVEIMKIALTRTINEKEFLDMLTNTEKIALKFIMSYIDEKGEGVVSISQLTEKSKISRPVFKSVLNKLKNMEIAELSNMGVKGTQIKIIDGVFLNIDKYIDK